MTTSNSSSNVISRPAAFRPGRFRIFGIGLLALLLATGAATTSEPLQVLNPVPGTPPAADFTLTDREGRRHRLADYRGKVVIVNFWSVWCRPCRKEMPSMQRAWEQLQDRGVMLVAVNYGDTPENVAAFFSNLSVDFPVLLGGDQAMVDTWGVKGLPTTYVVDPQGRLAYKLVGEREWDDPSILAKVLALKS